MSALCFLLNFLWLSTPVQSTFTVVGSVHDQTGKTVSGVRLLVIDENFQTIRTLFIDMSGQYTIRGLRQGKFTFRVDTTGTEYEEQSQQIELQAMRLFGGDETFPLHFKLKFKKGAAPPTKDSAAVFAQEIPAKARQEFERGVKYLKSQKSDQGIASLRKALEIFPNYYDALDLLGTEYIKASLYEAALPLFTHGFEVNKRSFKCLYGIGTAHLKLNHLTEAVSFLEQATQMEATSVNGWMMLGVAYGTGGVFAKAEASFQKALQLGGTAAAEAHFYLAGLFNKQDRFAEARQELELYLKDGKNLKDPGQIKAMIEKLRAREQQPLLTMAIASEPKNLPAVEAAPTAVSAEAALSAALNAVALKTVEPLSPVAQELLRASESTGGQMHQQLRDYTYQLKKTRRILNKEGKSTHSQEQIFEAYPVRGEHVLIKLSTNGIPSRTLADDRTEAAKQLAAAEQAGAAAPNSKVNLISDYMSAGIMGVVNGNPAYVSVNLAAFFANVEFYAPRQETIQTRSTMVLNFRPRGGSAVLPQFSYAKRLVGTVWIDDADKVVTRLEGWPASVEAFDLIQTTAPRADAALIYQQSRQLDGLWVPTLISLNANGRPEIFNGLNWEVVFEFSAYKKFNTTANEKLVNPPEKAPLR